MISVVLVALLYSLIGGGLLYQRGAAVSPEEQEIPVEVVVEPPPPPPPEPKKAEEPPPPPAPDLTPATDAPKAGTAETDNGDKEKDAKPPPAPDEPDKSAEKPTGTDAQTAPPKPDPAPEAPPSPEPTPQPTPVETPPPLKDAQDGEIPKAAPSPQPEKTAEPAPDKPAPPAGKGKPQPMFAALPDVDFGGAAIKTPVTGGAARGNYLSIVYGLIMPHVRKPSDARAMVGRGKGVVVFSLDGQGRLIDRWIEEASGSPELDKSVFNAIGAASPFPPPPGRGKVQMRFTYDGD